MVFMNEGGSNVKLLPLRTQCPHPRIPIRLELFMLRTLPGGNVIHDSSSNDLLETNSLHTVNTIVSASSHTCAITEFSHV